MKTGPQDNIRKLIENVKLPKIAKVRQHFDKSHIEDVAGTTAAKLREQGLDERIKPGMRVVLTGSSRYIADAVPVLRETARFVRECGLGRPEGTNEPLDDVATECELMEHLALRAAGAEPPEGAPADADLPGGSPEAAYGAFLEEHARAWMPRFADAVAAESRVPFYRDAAAFLGALVAQ